MSTQKGRDLANRLLRGYLPYEHGRDLHELDEACSLLMRHGNSWFRNEERFASDPRSAEEPEHSRLERRQDQLEQLLRVNFLRLNPPAGWRLVFDGLFARIVTPDEREIPLADD